MDIVEYNRRAWDGLVERGNAWTIPVSHEFVAAARDGRWEIVLTPCRPVPRSWFPVLAGANTLCLAGSGGQQAPLLAAAGAAVTVLDNSPRQLAQDRLVAEREGLEIVTVQGDMRDLGAFQADSFDLVVHPCSNCFVPEVRGIWREVCRVLRPGGILMAGYVNPVVYVFDAAASEHGELIVRHTLPYSDQVNLTEEERRALAEAGGSPSTCPPSSPPGRGSSPRWARQPEDDCGTYTGSSLNGWPAGRGRLRSPGVCRKSTRASTSS